MPNRDRVAIGDLKPLDMPAHQALRADLARLSDEELLESVESPKRGDWLVINTRTGLLFDGNGRAYELLRRARRAAGRISFSTTVPVEYYSPNYAMFPDMDFSRGVAMSSRSLVHQLLFEALVEMRQRGHDSGDNVVFHLSDLFHNAVLQMDQADDEASEDDILEFIKRRAKEKGCEAWLQQQLDRIELKAAAE